MRYNDLDAAFLRYITKDTQIPHYIHAYYLPFFQNCKHVVDLACGQGNFLKELAMAGISAVGVDLDPECVADARAQGVEVICQDVFEFLQQAPPASIDGIFCAHLVEHLAYPQVLHLIELSYQALAEGGLMLIATPNARALYAHLESFYMHFGHVNFYHPVLLQFFLDYAGFDNPQQGENPRTASLLWDRAIAAATVSLPSLSPPGLSANFLAYECVIPRPKHNLLRQLIWRVKQWLTRMLVQPYADQLVLELNRRLADIQRQSINLTGLVNNRVQNIESLLVGLDRPMECYVVASKGQRFIQMPAREVIGDQ